MSVNSAVASQKTKKNKKKNKRQQRNKIEKDSIWK